MLPLRVLLDDLRQLPVFVRLGAALRRASPDGRETLATLIRRHAERIPERIAVRGESEAVSYAGLNAGANRYVDLLRQAGVGRGDVVAIMMQNGAAMLMAEAAMAKLGAVGALINTHLTGAPLAHVLGASGARHLLVDAAGTPAVGGLPGLAMKVWSLASERPAGFEDLTAALAAASPREPEIADLRGHDVFLYVYTSGTSGLPKPAIVRHARFTMGGIALGGLFGITADDCIYAPLPLYHGESNFVGFSVAVRAGACFATRRKFSAGEFLNDVRRHGATMFVYVGELCRYVLRQPPTPHDRDHRLRLAAGAGLRPDIWEEFQRRFGIARIVEMYGCTEGNVSLMNLAGRRGSVGRAHPFQHRNIRLVRRDPATGDLVRGADGFFVECAPGEPGELLGRIQTAGAAMSYDGYVDRAATEHKIVRGAFEPGDAYFRTGDILRRDADFYYYFVDRAGDTFRWKGENVSTEEVGQILSHAPGVTEANVYGVGVPGEDGRAGMAALVLAPGAAFDPAAFYRHAEQLPSYARPLYVRIVPEMDVTGTLKQRKIELQREGYDPARVSDALYVRDDARRTYARLRPPDR